MRVRVFCLASAILHTNHIGYVGLPWLISYHPHPLAKWNVLTASCIIPTAEVSNMLTRFPICAGKYLLLEGKREFSLMLVIRSLWPTYFGEKLDGSCLSLNFICLILTKRLEGFPKCMATAKHRTKGPITEFSRLASIAEITMLCFNRASYFLGSM